MRLIHTFLRIIVSVVLAACPLACGAGMQQTNEAQLTPEEAAIPLVLLYDYGRTGVAAEVERVVREQLTLAGYTIASGAEYAVTAHLAVKATKNQGFIKITVNGKQRVSDDVEVTLEVLEAGAVVQQFSTSFSATNGEVTPSDLSEVIDGFRNSAQVRRIQSVVAKRKREALAAADKKRLEEQQQRDAQAAEDARRRKAEDDAAWTASGWQKCARPAAVTDCDGVLRYQEQRTEGAHVDEARTMLNASEPQIAALRMKENQQAVDAAKRAAAEQAEREKNEQKAEQLKREREQCNAACAADCSGSPPQSRQQCVTGCKQLKKCP